MSRLELAILAGADSKAFLAGFTAQVDRLEKITKKLNVVKAKADDDEEEQDDADEETEETETPKKKGKGKKAKDQDEEDDDTDDEAEESDSDEESGDEESDSDSDSNDEADEETEDDEEPPKKSAKGKGAKITKEMIKDACRAYMAETSRAEVERILQKKFGTKKVGELDPDDYPKVMKVLEL